jgi:hypothetical protein
MRCSSLNVYPVFLACYLIWGNILCERNIFHIRTVVLSSVVHLFLNGDLLQLIVNIHKNHLHQNQKPGQFLWGYDFCSSNLVTETKNFGFVAVLLLCVVSELQKPFSPRLEHTYRKHLIWTQTQDSFEVCDLCSCTLLAEKKFFFMPFYCHALCPSDKDHS